MWGRYSLTLRILIFFNQVVLYHACARDVVLDVHDDASPPYLDLCHPNRFAEIYTTSHQYFAQSIPNKHRSYTESKFVLRQIPTFHGDKTKAKHLRTYLLK